MDQRGIGVAKLIIVSAILVTVVVGGACLLIINLAPQGGIIKSATSLDFKVDTTLMGHPLTMRFRAKNIGSSDLKMRVDRNMVGEIELGDESVIPENSITLLDAGEKTLWGWTPEGAWQSPAQAERELLIENYKTTLAAYQDELSGWSGGDLTCIDPITGTSARIYDIQVNPSLPDSLFQI